MAKVKKTEVEITEEGIIMIDNLPTDFENLYNMIKSKSCRIYMKSKASYLCLLVPFEHWLSENVSEDDFKEVVSYIRNEWQIHLDIVSIFDYEE